MMLTNPFRFASGAASDPYFANVVYLNHFEGADGSTVFTDSSASAKTITAFGNAQIDTAQSKFGTASGLYDGTGDYLSVASSADFNFGSGAFTVEFFVRFNVAGGRVSAFYTGGNGVIFITPNTGNVLVYRGVVCANGGSTVFSANTWYHMAVTRSGNNYTVWRDGSSYATGSEPNTFGDTAAMIDSGGFGSEHLNGWFDEYRVTKGVARYTENFTPPTAQFPDQ